MNRAGVFLFFLALALLAAWYHLPVCMCVATFFSLLALTLVYKQIRMDQSEAVAMLTGTPAPEDEVESKFQIQFPWWPWVSYSSVRRRQC